MWGQSLCYQYYTSPLNNVMNKNLFRAVRSEQHIKQRKKCAGIRTWLNGNAVFYETFICFYISVKLNLFVSVFVHKCLMMLNDVEYTTFKMFVTQMSNYLFVTSFQLMFHKTLRYRLARASDCLQKLHYVIYNISQARIA